MFLFSFPILNLTFDTHYEPEERSSRQNIEKKYKNVLVNHQDHGFCEHDIFPTILFNILLLDS